MIDPVDKQAQVRLAHLDSSPGHRESGQSACFGQ
jgi:hypothetical protein